MSRDPRKDRARQWLRYYIATEEHDALPCTCRGYTRNPKTQPGCGTFAWRMHIELRLGPEPCPEPMFASLSLDGLREMLKAYETDA